MTTYKEYVMDFDKFMYINESKFNEMMSGDDENTEMESDDEYSEEMMEGIDTNYEKEVIELTESFLSDIEMDFATLNESEILESINLIPIIDTLLENLTDGTVLESVIDTLESYESLYEATEPNKKANLLGKVKNFASNLWGKFKAWMAASKAQISKIKDSAKKKMAEKDLNNKAKAKMSDIKSKIANAKTSVMGKIKNIVSKKKGPNRQAATA